MVQFAYTSQTWSTLAKNPQDRSQLLSHLAEQLGGRLLDFYYCFGEFDGVLIMEMPDDTATAAAVLAAIGAGHLRANLTTKLMTVPEAMEAMRKAGSLGFAAPESTH
jgi:uncharacterized protein with GYD domain